MNLLNRLYILKTASSEVNKRTLFKHRCTTYIPDLFFAFCFAFLFFAAQCFDKTFMVLLFCWGRSPVGAVVFSAFVILPLVCTFEFEKNHEDCVPGYKMYSWFSTVVTLVGWGPFLICGKALRDTFDSHSDLKFVSFPIFHIKEEDMNAMKIYYIFNVAVKSIPQFYIVSTLIMKRYITGVLAILGQVSLLVNMVLFSLAMAMTFPLRSTPRVYTSSFCVPFNAFCKFMATLCGCGINLAVFAMLFSSTGYYALLIQAIKSLLWLFPSWWALNTQPHPLHGACFTLYLFFLTLIFSFIYIHPFQGKGKLLYYFFYLMAFWSEIFCIYIFTDASNQHICIYFALKTVMIGFLSCYGLVNILHKYKFEESGYEVETKVQEKRENEGKLDSKEEKNIGRNKVQANPDKPNIVASDVEPQSSKVEEKAEVDETKRIEKTDVEAGGSKSAKE